MMMRRDFFGAGAAAIAGVSLIVSLAPGAAAQEASGDLDPRLVKLVASISEERLGAILKKLESFETRNTLSSVDLPARGIGAARQWIFDEMKSYSPRLQVSFDTHQITKAARIWKDVELRNVVAILPGKTEAAKSRWIMVGGHYDTVNLRNAAELRGHPEQA